MTRSKSIEVTLKVDGEVSSFECRSSRLLVDALRGDCGRTSVKVGCETGSCGACAVLLDGVPTLSCITLASDADGSRIETVEGLSDSSGSLHPLQEAFLKHHAVQCGFCTPGMIMAAKALLDVNPAPTESEILQAISGNLCRCTGYLSIVRAIADASVAWSSRTGVSSGGKQVHG